MWPLLKHSPDPRVRSYRIQRLFPLGAESAAIVKRFHDAPNLSARRALLLALGEFDEVTLPPAPCAAGCSVPKTGYISEVMAKYAAHNIAGSLEGKPLRPKPTTEIDAKCVLDAGNQGIIMYTDRIYAPRNRKWQLLIPGPWAHGRKVWFEKYFLWKMRTGPVNWP